MTHDDYYHLLPRTALAHLKCMAEEILGERVISLGTLSAEIHV